jgi:hypothetical protein
MARKERLLRRMPAQPIIEVKRPIETARVEMMSSERLPTLMISALSQMLNQVRRQTMMPTRVYAVSYDTKKNQYQVE